MLCLSLKRLNFQAPVACQQWGRIADYHQVWYQGRAKAFGPLKLPWTKKVKSLIEEKSGLATDTEL